MFTPAICDKPAERRRRRGVEPIRFAPDMNKTKRRPRFLSQQRGGPDGRGILVIIRDTNDDWTN